MMSVFISKGSAFRFVAKRKRSFGVACFLVAIFLMVGSLAATAQFGVSKSKSYSRVRLTTVVSNPTNYVNIQSDTTIAPQSTVNNTPVVYQNNSAISSDNTSVKTQITVNGQDVPVPENGTISQEIPVTNDSQAIEIQIESHSASTSPDVTNNNDTSLDLSSSTFEYHYNSDTGSNISVEVNQ
jgi:hypothetical protein